MRRNVLFVFLHVRSHRHVGAPGDSRHLSLSLSLLYKDTRRGLVRSWVGECGRELRCGFWWFATMDCRKLILGDITACVFPRRPTTAWRVSWSQSQSRLHPQVPRHFFQCNELKMTCVYALYCVIHLTFEISHDTLAWSGARIDVTRQTSDNHTNIWGSL